MLELHREAENYMAEGVLEPCPGPSLATDSYDFTVDEVEKRKEIRHKREAEYAKNCRGEGDPKVEYDILWHLQQANDDGGRFAHCQSPNRWTTRCTGPSPGICAAAPATWTSSKSSGRLRTNPMIVEGQICGGLTEGFAMSAMQWITFDDNGNCIGSNFMDYLVPTAWETPRFELLATEVPSPHHPIGAKGWGSQPPSGRTSCLRERGDRHHVLSRGPRY